MYAPRLLLEFMRGVLPQTKARRLKQPTFEILNSFQLEWEVSALLLAASENLIFAPKRWTMAPRTWNGARVRVRHGMWFALRVQLVSYL